MTEFDSEEKELRTVVFKDQENLEDTVEVVHESLPEVKDAEENMVIEPVTMLDYLKQMHPSFGTSIENIQKIVENPLESYLRTEAEKLLDGRSKHESFSCGDAYISIDLGYVILGSILQVYEAN